MIARLLRLTVAVLCALACLAPGALAQSGRIPVKVVAGRLVARCDLSTEVRRIPVHLFVEYDNPCGLEVHNRAAAPLRVERQDGSTRPITIHFQGGEVVVDTRELGDQDELDAFTKWYSVELGENAVVGTIGAGILAKHHLVFDVGSGAIEFGPPKERSGERPEAPPGGASLPVSIKNDMVWLPMLLADDEPRSVAFGSSRYDTIVDEDLCESKGAPAGDLGEALIGSCDVSQYVALRPGPVPFTHADGALGVLGIGLLESLRVEIDRVNRWVTITPVADPEFPSADRAFFEAMVTEDTDALLAYLEAHPESRCAREAAELLLDWMVSEGYEGEELHEALAWVDKTCIPDLRATAALELLKELQGLGLNDAAVKVGEFGVEGGRDDRYPEAIHELHSALGAMLLEQGEGRDAWRHLLSAAFGIPEDGMVNLNLGRFYEKEGRNRRAFSRYVQAVIQPESGPQAMEGLVRLQKTMDADEAMSVDLVERLISGRVEGFGAATKFEYGEQTNTNRIVLIEHLTNAHEEYANGGALGLEGALDHFDRDRVAVVSFHMPQPQLDPLYNEAARSALLLHNPQGSVFLINGGSQVTGRARTRDKEKVYNAIRGAVARELAKPSDYDIELQAEVKGGVLSGSVSVTGPESWDATLELWLVERGVLFPGKSKVVIHRMVVRDFLLEQARGETLAIGDDGAMRRTFERVLSEIKTDNEAYLTKRAERTSELIDLVSTAVDPEQVSVVAVLRGGFGGEVLQACQLDAKVVEVE